MYFLFDICNNYNFLTVFLLIKYLFSIICTIVPLILIYRCIVPFFKTVIFGNEFTGDFSSIVKSIIAGLVIFLLPSIFTFIFTDLVDETSSLGLCFSNANLDKIDELRDSEYDALNSENQKNKELLENAAIDRAEQEKERNDAIKEEKKEREEQDNGNSSNNNSSVSPSSGNASLKNASKNIIIGDSRTVGMCASLTGDWTNCQYSNGGAFVNGNDIYIAQGSMGYSWFNSTAVSAVNNIISSNPNVTYNIYSLMGVNFLLSDIDKYISKYSELSNDYWKNHNIILVSVNPVDEDKEAQYGYSTKNSDIVLFNNKLKNGTFGISNIKYCDTYNSIVNNLGTSDGLHYTSATYSIIYNNMKSCGS